MLISNMMSVTYPDGRLGGSKPPLNLRNFLSCVFVQKYCYAPVFMKSKNFVQENVKNCTLISHFALPWTPLGLRSARSPRSVPFYTIPDPPLHCEILATPMVKPIPITTPQGSWLWQLQTYSGNMNSSHVGYYSSCNLHKCCHDFLIRTVSMPSKFLST